MYITNVHVITNIENKHELGQTRSRLGTRHVVTSMDAYLGALGTGCFMGYPGFVFRILRCTGTWSTFLGGKLPLPEGGNKQVV